MIDLFLTWPLWGFPRCLCNLVPNIQQNLERDWARPVGLFAWGDSPVSHCRAGSTLYHLEATGLQCSSKLHCCEIRSAEKAENHKPCPGLLSLLRNRFLSCLCLLFQEALFVSCIWNSQPVLCFQEFTYSHLGSRDSPAANTYFL